MSPDSMCVEGTSQIKSNTARVVPCAFHEGASSYTCNLPKVRTTKAADDKYQRKKLSAYHRADVGL